MSRPYLWRNDVTGRAVSWRVWVLIWLCPVIFALAAVWLFAQTWYDLTHSVEADAQVVRIYRWDDTGGVAPLMRYTDPQGQTHEATPGLRHPDWDFEIGSTRPIRYFPDRQGDIILPGAHNWFVAQVIAVIALVLVIPALILHRRLRRWLKERSVA
ncbi:hypothetical protein A8B82_17850 [Sulfitobacter sp. EhC04]|uniref:hypothetical protein n=1 Tax=Sulfitobacter sp. EhC04 TaxID=1849168 RepID=UPI0007F4F549|nr:hypothetical protein [Sulfitobacter sp. EhC04]OAN74621.1 hypothetical protein A8B82_17850 [Sulfitobacter sp. EhC04]